MKKKHINIQIDSINLLNNNQFLAFLEFEAEYSAVVRGGSLSSFLGNQERKRLVSDINLLSTREKLNLINSGFIGKN